MPHPYQMARDIAMAKKNKAAAPEMPEYQAGDWTRDEQHTISSEAYAIFGRDPTMGRMAAIRQAVNLLPKKRRRFIAKWYHVRNFIEKDWGVLDESTGRNYAQPNAEHVPLTDIPTNDAALSVEPQAALPIEAPAPVETPAENVAEPEVQAVPAAEKVAKPQKSPVFWKPDEIEKVAIAAAELLIEGFNSKPLPLIREAQKRALGDDRQRVLQTIDHLKGTPERAAELVPIIKRRNEQREKEAQEAQEAAERMEQERIEREERERLANEERIKAEAQAEATRILAEREAERQKIHTEAFNSAVAQAVQKQMDLAPYTAILGALAKKVLGDFMEPLMKGMEERMEAKMLGILDQLTQPTEPAATVPDNVHQIKKANHLNIVVVGIGNQEYDQLRKDFFGDVAFKQVKVLADSRGGQTAQAMLEAAKGMDAVCAMHHVVGADVKMAAVKLKEMKVPYIAVTGNLRDLRSRIKSALTGELPFEVAA